MKRDLMLSEYLPHAKFLFEVLHNFSDNLSFEIGICLPNFLGRKLKLVEVKWQAFGSMDDVKEIPL